MGRSQARIDVASVRGPVDWRAGACPVVLHFLAWWSIIGWAMVAVMELVMLVDEAYFLHDLTGWQSNATRWLIGELVVWFLVAAMSMLFVGFVLWWLGRLRRLWGTSSGPPRIATALTAVVWLGLTVLSAWFATDSYGSDDLLSQIDYALHNTGVILDVAFGLTVLGAALMTRRGSLQPDPAST